MTEPQEQQRDFISKVALLLAIGGLIVPLAVATLAYVMPGVHVSDAQSRTLLIVAVGIGLIAEVFAVVLGIAGWNHLFGKVAVACSGMVLLATTVGFTASLLLGYIRI